MSKKQDKLIYSSTKDILNQISMSKEVLRATQVIKNHTLNDLRNYNELIKSNKLIYSSTKDILNQVSISKEVLRATQVIKNHTLNDLRNYNELIKSNKHLYSSLNKDLYNNMMTMSKALESNSIRLKPNSKINFKEISQHINSAYDYIDEIISCQETNLSDENIDTEEVTTVERKNLISYLVEHKQSIEVIILILSFLISTFLDILSFLHKTNNQPQNINYIQNTINIINSLDNNTKDIINNSVIDDN